MMDSVTVYSAGAGSGKTHTICQQIQKRIAAGSIDPAGIIATTFTRKAAAELTARIQRFLLDPQLNPDATSAQRIEQAESVDRALIGTVHSVGRRLLRRYAMLRGQSPLLEPLEEEAGRRHLRDLMAELDHGTWDQVERIGRRLGQHTLDELVKDLLDQKRTNGITGLEFVEHLRQSGADYVAIIAPEGADEEAIPFGPLYDLAAETIDALEANHDGTKATTAVIDKLKEIATRRKGVWGDWGTMAKLKPGAKNRATVARLMAMAARVRTHPRFHADLQEFLGGLSELVLGLEGKYRRYKDQRGLADFTDQEADFLRLLDDEEVAKDIQSTLQLVVVDEFQDTNPIQLAIFSRLALLAKESIWVGDTKQSIYGFRNADPALMESALGSIDPSQTRKLTQNWRSRPGLVRLVGELFQPVFGEDARLQPARKPPAAAERWLLPDDRSNGPAFAALAEGVRCLQRQGDRLGEIAVLTRSNKQALGIAQSLERHSIAALVHRPGLMATREGRLVQAGLALVADHNDSLAAATIKHILADPTEPTPSWVTQRAAEVAENGFRPFHDDERLRPLRSIPRASTTPADAVIKTIAALGLPDRIAGWGRPQQRAANLDALCEAARKYEADVQQQGDAPTINGLVSHLNDLAKTEADHLPVEGGAEAVSILTVHKAKGLEFPTVILPFVSRPQKPDPFKIRVVGGNASAGLPLEGRTVRFFPYPFGSNAFGRSGDGIGLFEMIMKTDEGQEILRRHEAEEKRLLYVATTRARRRMVLAHRPKKYPVLDRLTAHTQLLPPAPETQANLPGLELDYCVRVLEAPAQAPGPVEPTQWLVGAAGPSNYPDRFVSPSTGAPRVQAEASLIRLASKPLRAPIPSHAMVAVGEAVHAVLAASAVKIGSAAEKMAHQLLKNHQVDGHLNAGQIVEAARRLNTWIERTMPGATRLAEYPVTAPRGDGTIWNGSIDLLVVDAQGRALIIDHKTGADTETDPQRAAVAFAPQLSAYAQALRTLGVDVVGTFVHMPLSAAMVRLTVAPGPEP